MTSTVTTFTANAPNRYPCGFEKQMQHADYNAFGRWYDTHCLLDRHEPSSARMAQSYGTGEAAALQPMNVAA